MLVNALMLLIVSSKRSNCSCLSYHQMVTWRPSLAFARNYLHRLRVCAVGIEEVSEIRTQYSTLVEGLSRRLGCFSSDIDELYQIDPSQFETVDPMNTADSESDSDYRDSEDGGSESDLESLPG